MEFSGYENILYANPDLALFSAFLAGIASSISPCAIAAVPLVIGYVGGYAGGSRWRSFGYALSFVLGMAITFTFAGVAMVTTGAVLGPSQKTWQIIMAALAILFGGHLVRLWQIPRLSMKSCSLPQLKWRGAFGAAVVGGLSGIVFSPCATPILAGILTIIGSQVDPQFGILLMFAYSIGHGALLLIAGSSLGFTQWLIQSKLAINIGKVFTYLSGGALMLYGGYLLHKVI